VPATGAALDTDVCAESADAEPPPFEAVTLTRSVAPTSALATVYVEAFAPEIDVHALPAASHRRHW